MSAHVVPARVYLAVFLGLIILTVVTVGAAGQDFGSLNTVIALTIAVVKATLVVMYFMHVRYGSRLTTLVVWAGFVWLALLIFFTLADYLSRPWLVTPAP